MKLSKREIVLIIILLVAVVGYFTYTYAPIDKLFNLEALKEEHSQKKHEYDTMSQNIILKKSFEEKAQTLSAEINDMNVISDLQQEKVIVFLNNYFADGNIDVSNISFTDSSVVSMNPIPEPGEAKALSSLDVMMNDINGISSQTGENKESSEEAKDDNAARQPSLSVHQISANITFESKYNDLLRFIDAIQNNSVDISITNISTLSPGGDLLQGTIVMNFYEIPKLTEFEENNDEWNWEDLARYGKGNPFSSDASAVLYNSGGNFDFYVNLEPESSDLPTLLVGKTEDTTRSTYISEDSNTVESVQFYFKGENNNFYYRYSTKNNSYPKTEEWQEFTPSDEEGIRIRVYSGTRSSTTDSAGANIGVTNTSGLKVYFEIENDSATNPRVTFKDAKSVIVTRK